jgi:cell division transport system permease protein
MSLSYTLKESISGFRRTKLSSIASILTISISLLLLGVFGILSLNAARFIDALRSKVELEAFLTEPATPEGIQALQKTIAAIEGVESVTFISKEEAAKIFKREFGEDILSVLEFNPLPPSFRVALEKERKTSAGAQSVHARLSALSGIESVAYRKALIELIDKRTDAANTITLGLGILISLSAIVLVSNTIRLAIYAKRRLIRTMELVGATWSFIRLPFLLEGLMHGLIGGALAAGLLFAVFDRLVPFFLQDLARFIQADTFFYVMVIAAGTVLGLIGSVISVLRFIQPTRTG